MVFFNDPSMMGCVLKGFSRGTLDVLGMSGAMMLSVVVAKSSLAVVVVVITELLCNARMFCETSPKRKIVCCIVLCY